jgi:hypothetical protein
MSSSRSIAAARSRRAGESQPPVSGGRPGTSIASHSAFVPQQMQPPPNNVRVGKAPINQQQQPQQMQPPSNGLPFTKLSISDAIGLITLRLGRVEQFVIDYENGEIATGPQSEESIPKNSKIIDNSVLANIINRLDALEKKEPSTSSNSFSNVNNEQISKIEKDLKETKDLLAHMLFKFELFSKETTDKFNDFEGAITEIEKNMEAPQFTEINDTISANIDISTEEINVPFNALDLKNLVKQELANSEQNN